MENTRTRSLSVDNSEGRERERERERSRGERAKQKRRATNHRKKSVLAERKEKQSRLEMCADVEYVQKMHTQRLSLYILPS
jgi:hypothetical protein